jgi:hypothetical protein
MSDPNPSFPADLLALPSTPSRDGDESFISDITGDHYHGTPPHPSSSSPNKALRGGRKKKNNANINTNDSTSVFKATSLLSGAATGIYQSMVVGARNSANDEDDDWSEETPAHPLEQANDAHSFVTADQTHSMMPRSNTELLQDDEHNNLSQRFYGFDFLKDSVSEMTWSRRIALGLLQKSWYYPPHLQAPTTAEGEEGNGKEQPPEEKAQLTMESYPFSVTKREYPSLEKAWACEFLVVLAVCGSALRPTFHCISYMQHGINNQRTHSVVLFLLSPQTLSTWPCPDIPLSPRPTWAFRSRYALAFVVNSFAKPTSSYHEPSPVSATCPPSSTIPSSHLTNKWETLAWALACIFRRSGQSWC